MKRLILYDSWIIGVAMDPRILPFLVWNHPSVLGFHLYIFSIFERVDLKPSNMFEVDQLLCRSSLVNTFNIAIFNNVGYWLAWGYTIVSRDSKIIVYLWKCLRGTQLCPQDFGVMFFSFFYFLVFNCFFYFFVFNYNNVWFNSLFCILFQYNNFWYNII